MSFNMSLIGKGLFLKYLLTIIIIIINIKSTCSYEDQKPFILTCIMDHCVKAR